MPKQKVGKWKKSGEEFVKLNIDGARTGSERAASSFVIHDSQGRVLCCGARSLGMVFSVQAELLSMTTLLLVFWKL